MKNGSHGLLLTILLVCAAASLSAQEASESNIVAKAREFSTAEASTAGRIVAIHRFVRDEIRQTATQWG